jgi:hypothetical protein
MRRLPFIILAFLCFIPGISPAKDLPKIAVWDLTPGDIKPAYAQDLTSILVSEISKLEKYEVYSQENVRTLAGWTAGRMALGCTDTKCLTALGQMDIAKLISGRVGKIGNSYSVSLNLFDTQNSKAEKAVSEIGRSEDELISLVQVAVRKLLGVEVAPIKAERLPSPSTASEKDKDDRFIAYDNGTVLDKETGLMWAAKDNGFDIEWRHAKRYCEKYRGGGYTDWRMPTAEDLDGLFDPLTSYKIGPKGYPVYLTNLIQLTGCCPWGSDVRDDKHAAYNFHGGVRPIWDTHGYYWNRRALPVRSAK